METSNAKLTGAGALLGRHKVSGLPTVYYVPEYITSEEEKTLLSRVDAPNSKWTQLKRRRVQNWGGIVHPKGMVPSALPDWIKGLIARLFEDTGVFQDSLNHVLINEYNPGEGILSHEDGPLYFPAVAILSLGATVVIRFTRKSRDQDLPPADQDPPPARVEGRGEETPSGETPESVEKGKGAARDEQMVDGDEVAVSKEVYETPETDQDPNLIPDTVSLVLKPRSLLVFKDLAYTHYLHGIEETGVDQLDESLSNRTQAGIGQDTDRVTRTGRRVSMTCRRVLKMVNVSRILPGLMKRK
mmetsp:Transcript_24569/g.29771  ORF Transcript_24569/g.29771 Transcript_24569/m.29771 type:complete len:300 (+) Transcript_24569:443-1342(+)|eukprot:CAMPEP_0197846132 /NCGR_PEP_ID=MMETSP1438-20131217/2939_1 /TAXON_ID=1461541 /ORGANISM="Pterosperma sp., Strain CCMP1384" /LENGTH=299 /DNA_ID=CAMNT_0043457679 /DNA_START=436 /DNA_END=1335 /DNA_ORIENTATION=+